MVVAVVLLAAACGNGADVDTTLRGSGGRILEAGRVGTLALRVGDCFRQPSSATVTSVEGVPCGRAHDGQVVGLVELEAPADALWPGPDTLAAVAAERCLALVVTGLADSVRAGGLALSAYVPDAGGWAEGDRSVVCWVESADGSPLVGDIFSGSA